MIMESSVEQSTKTESTNSPWSLVACSSWLSGQSFAIPRHADLSPVKVGRGKNCDIIFPGTHLSREHIAIFIQDQGLLVKDLNSANGTYINNQRVKQGFVRPGDTLRLDVYTFTVEGPESIEPAEGEVETAPDIELDFLHDAKSALGSTQINETLSQEELEERKEDDDRLTPAKQWKTRPTSPGNRGVEEEEEKASNIGLKLVASSLFMVVVALCAYLFFI